jgi:hypothetical protein
LDFLKITNLHLHWYCVEMTTKKDYAD